MKKILSVLTAFSVLLVCGCAKQKSKEELTFGELNATVNSSLKKKQYNEAAENLEVIVSRFSDRPDIAKYKLALAQAYFKIGKFPSAYELYNHYNNFYPSDKNAETAKYRAILSMFYQTLRMECDQTKTVETNKLCEEYLQNPSYTRHAKDVRDILHTCQQKLISKEIYVFNFYLHRNKYEAANSRIKYLEKEFLPKDNSLNARLLYLKCQLAKKSKNKNELNESMIKLSRDYPESNYTQMAQSLVAEPKFLF